MVSSVAFADEPGERREGTIVEEAGDCQYLVLELQKNGEEKEYALLEWHGAESPRRGDILSGRFDYGPEEVLNVSADVILDIWVEEFYFSFGEAIEDFFERCG